jgi:purine-binding chemotaxis protein CheW
MGAMESIDPGGRAGSDAPTPQFEGGPAGLCMSGGEFLTFSLGSEEYVVDILKVQEIRHYEKPTQIAGAPPYIKGVVNLRGVIVPLVDLRLHLGVSQASYDGSTVVIILNLRQRVVGVVVDGVSDVIALKPEQIHPAAEWRGSTNLGFLTGVGCVKNGEQERMLILLDIEQLMAGEDLDLA